jgi:hypothetical protein
LRLSPRNLALVSGSQNRTSKNEATMKNTLLALLGFILLSAPLSATAQFTYNNNGDGTCTITGYGGPGGAVTIPDSTNGLSVVSIGNYAFYNNSTLTSVTIPDSVTSFGYEAFAGCSSLTGVTVPRSVTMIGNLAFAYCTSMTNVTMRDGVAYILDEAFTSCSSLTSVTVPNSVTFIGDLVFSECGSLTNITIGSGVTIIGESEFRDCPSLTGYFLGNAPGDNGHVFDNRFGVPGSVFVLYLPGTTGWGPFFSGRPTFLLNPQAGASRVTDGHFGFDIHGPANTIVVVEACTNLSHPVWLPVSTNALDGSGASSFSDSQSADNPASFYRFYLPLAP